VLCLDTRSDISVNEKYNISDIGISYGDEMYPLDASLYLESNGTESVCVVISNDIINQIYGKPLFPIKKIYDWDQLKLLILTNAEEGVYYAVGSLYLLVAVYGLLEIALLTKFGNNKSVLPVRLLISIFTLQDSLRVIYYFVYPTGKLGSAGGTLVLSELPTFLFFSGFSILVCVWAIVAHNKLNKATSAFDAAKKFKGLAISANVVTYMIFVALILLYEYVPEKNFKYENICGLSTKAEVPLMQTPQWQIVIAYKFFILVLGLLIGISFGIYAYLVFRKVKSLMRRVKKNERKLLFVGIIGTISFISYSIIIIIQAFSHQIIIMAFFICAVELITQIALIYSYGYISKKAFRNNSSSSVELTTTTHRDSQST